MDGQARSYYGAGAALGIEPLTYELGAAVKVQRVSLGPLAPEVRQVLRGYDTRQAPALLHLVMLNAAGAVTSVEEAFKGVIDRWLADRDFVTREEFEAVREMAVKARTENAELRAMIERWFGTLNRTLTPRLPGHTHSDLPLNFHPTATGARFLFTPVGAG